MAFYSHADRHVIRYRLLRISACFHIAALITTNLARVAIDNHCNTLPEPPLVGAAFSLE